MRAEKKFTVISTEIKIGIFDREDLLGEPAGTRTQNPCLKRAVLHR